MTVQIVKFDYDGPWDAQFLAPQSQSSPTQWRINRAGEELKAIQLEPAIGEVRIFERGFGVIKIAVSMFLIGVLLLSYIALTIKPVKDIGMTTTIATATQIVNEQIEAALAVRSPASAEPSCQDITTFLQVTPAPVKDSRGLTLVPQWEPTSCPPIYPGVIRVRASVSQIGSPTPVATAVALIFVRSAA
jgi:hypothetical protein